MEFIPWFAWIAIAGIAAYAVVETVTRIRSGKQSSDKVSEAMVANTDATRALADKIDTLESRLARVEKTLTDIP